jgi:hypothetical protein
MGYLSSVDPRTSATTRIQEVDLGSGYLLHLGIIVLAMIACAGLPVHYEEPRALPGVISQALAGISVIISTLLGYAFVHALFFAKPEYKCVPASCWPLRQQIIVLAIPAIATGVLTILVAVFGRRRSWRIRALSPPIAWLILLAVQHFVWYSWLLPVFSGSPP